MVLRCFCDGGVSQESAWLHLQLPWLLSVLSSAQRDKAPKSNPFPNEVTQSIMDVSRKSILCLIACLTFAATRGFSPLSYSSTRSTVSDVFMQSRPLFMSESEQESDVEASAVNEAPKPAVKCPDCDLCDGSGRILGGLGASKYEGAGQGVIISFVFH